MESVYFDRDELMDPRMTAAPPLNTLINLDKVATPLRGSDMTRSMASSSQIQTPELAGLRSKATTHADLG